MTTTQSQIALWNMALALVGDDGAMGVDDDTRQARMCRAHYAAARDATLAAHPWNCAMARATLAALADAPGWGYERAFQLPADCLRVKTVHATDSWRREGDTILSNSDSCQIAYVRRLEDTTRYTPLLFSAVAHLLASRLAVPLVKDLALQRSLYAQWRQELDDARFIDAIEQGEEQADSGYTEGGRLSGPYTGAAENLG